MGGRMKLIGIDLDGTLLNSQKEISKENVEALRSIANDDDYFVFICSGRPAFNIKELLDKYDLDIAYVGSNGGLAYKGEELIFELPFTKDQAKNIYETIKDQPFLTYNKNSRFGEKDHVDRLEKLFQSSAHVLTEEEFNSFENYKKNVLADHLKEIDDFHAMFDEEDFDIFKFFMYLPIYEIKLEIQEKLSKLDGVYATESERTNLEIVPAHVNKGMVFKHLEDYLQLDDSVRIAIGDSLNDLEMFEMSDYGFAMENSYQEIKDLATHHVANNDEHGVAEAIEIIKSL